MKEEVLEELKKVVSVRGNTVETKIYIDGYMVFQYKVVGNKTYYLKEVDEDQFGQGVWQWEEVKEHSRNFPGLLQQLDLTRIGLRWLLKSNGLKRHLPARRKKLIKLLLAL